MRVNVLIAWFSKGFWQLELDPQLAVQQEHY